MSAGYALIDVHSHVVPVGFPANPSPATNARWPSLCMSDSGCGTLEIAGQAFRELDARSWRVAARLEDMDRDGVAMQVLSPMPELLSYWFSPSDGLEMARHINHVLAEMRVQAPARLHALGMVPLQDVELAARELARLKADGFAGVEIGSNVNGLVLGEACFTEFYAEAERLDLAVFVHALHPVGAERLGHFPDLIPYAAFPLDTALAAISVIRAGVPEAFPRLRLGFSHGGGAIAPLLHRLQHAWVVTQGFAGDLPREPREYAAGLFYDSLVYDSGYLTHLLDEIAPGQVFAGTDYPYLIEQKRPREFLERLPERHQASVFQECARRFLGLA